jgi:hypothetical protein
MSVVMMARAAENVPQLNEPQKRTAQTHSHSRNEQ